MELLKETSVKISNYKCFGEIEHGFDCLLPINLIIGRNNSGKSTLLELIEHTVNEDLNFPESLWHAKKRPEIVINSPLIESEIKPIFRENVRAGAIPGRNHWEYGQNLIGTKLKWRLGRGGTERLISIDECSATKPPLDNIQNAEHYKNELAKFKNNPFKNKVYKRIFAERNIEPEGDTANNLTVLGNGQGITNIIQNFINKANLPSDLVEKVFLTELNSILGSDSHFIDIVCQQIDNGKWEIFLEEEMKGRIPLSHTGSGIKTIIMVLVYIHLLPIAEKRSLTDFIFAFEELENNLHPALQRRLLNYIYGIAKKHKTIFFLTTHSNVSIDQFSKNSDGQIIHVTHDSKEAYARTARTYIDNKGVLDDLDLRASDLLQSNSIIWVEGPSDRIYLNRWIDLWSDGLLQEGTHYQCVFYGGRLLSYLTSRAPDEADNGVSILGVNRNSIIVIDSDKRTKQARINSTKKRIIAEIEESDGLAWVTKGKEIENYIPKETVSKLTEKKNIKHVGQFEDFFEYLGTIKKNEGKKYQNKKPLLAENVSQFLTKNNIQSVLDLAERLDEICNRIRTWNNL